MTRSILAVLAVGAFIGLLTATGGCKATGVGDPCVPEQEYDPTFNGFSEKEVNVESKSFQCQTRLCLVNHFRGRVSCPYGQGKDGSGPAPANACSVPGSTTKITGSDPQNQALVQAQCLDRVTDKAVYCSCRCKNVNGNTDDGANYCTCPDGFDCANLVSSIGAANEGLTGYYCIKHGTDYNANGSCTKGSCDPNAAGSGKTGDCGKQYQF